MTSITYLQEYTEQLWDCIIDPKISLGQSSKPDATKTSQKYSPWLLVIGKEQFTETRIFYENSPLSSKRKISQIYFLKMAEEVLCEL